MDGGDFEVYEPGQNQTLNGSGSSREDLRKKIEQVDMEDPESLWEFYPKDVRVKNKKILDPFMGGGTSLVEASRFGVETVGMDLNPVAWFVTKKELEAGQTSVSELEAAFEQVKEDVAGEILQYYQTPCPNGNHEAEVVYNFWVKELDCVSCGHTVPLFKDYRIAKERYADEPGYHVLCPSCDAVSVVSDWKSESECGECRHKWVPQEGHVSRGGYYNCPECGQKEAITDAIAEQGKPDERLYAVEYYCEECDNQGLEKSEHKGYKQAEAEDQRYLEEARQEWNTRTDLHQYVPDEEIPEGATTIVREGVNYDGHDLFNHGYENWTDLFTDRQLLSLSKLLKSIDSVQSEDARDYLLLAFSDSLMFQSTFSIYNQLRNNMEGIFRMNGYIPQRDFVENNVWGAEFGRGNFRNTWEKLLNGVEYANTPTDRYVSDGEMIESDGFAQPIGIDSEVKQGDMRELDIENEYDAVITDPPYYDNIIYSELSDYFYVWQKILLEDEYPGFDREYTPRADSIVTNPFLDKTAEDFEHEMGQALEVINNALKDDGTLAFTYHHSDEESWGELLESLCENGFEVTATYPINSDLNKFIEAREAVSFDIVIVARPFEDRIPISWNSLRRRIYKTAKDTREALEENRELKSGDIGVIEMGKCFQEYSKHHGRVRRAGSEMKAKEVVQEIYGIIQEDDVGEQDVYLDLLEENNPAYSDLSKLLRRSDASEDQMKDMKLVSTSGDFELYDWSSKQRQAYVQTKVEEGNDDLTDLDRAHFLRYRYEEDKSTTEYLQQWDTDSLQELCEGLAEATGDETYLKMLGVDESLADFGE
jgi:adenine-specific DNA methylase